MDVLFTSPHNLWLLMVIPVMVGFAQGMENLFILEREYNLTKYDTITMFIVHIVLSYALWNMFSSNIIILVVIISVGLMFTSELYDVLLDHNLMFRY